MSRLIAEENNAVDTILSWAQNVVGTNVVGTNVVGTNVLGTNVCGHKYR